MRVNSKYINNVLKNIGENLELNFHGINNGQFNDTFISA